MLRKTLIAVAAAGAMALGIGASATPAAAYHKGGVHIYIGTPYVFHHKRYHCHYKWVKVWSKKYHKYIKVKKKTYCHSKWHKY